MIPICGVIGSAAILRLLCGHAFVLMQPAWRGGLKTSEMLRALTERDTKDQDHEESLIIQARRLSITKIIAYFQEHNDGDYAHLLPDALIPESVRDRGNSGGENNSQANGSGNSSSNDNEEQDDEKNQDV